MSKPETWKSWEGRVVEGKFPLQQLLGGSDHSAVFLTQAPGAPSQKAAIKLLVIDEREVESHLARLRASAKLTHPHLIRILETGRCRIDGASIYVAMECADDDLSQILPERTLEPAEARDLLPPVIDALAYLHKNGFVHSRVKPSNVLAAGDQLKLSSDQVAPAAEPNGKRRRRDIYDAPETAAGIVSPAGDIWSLGVTLLEALTQNVTVAEQASPSNRDLPETIPDPFRGIVRESLQLDPNRRCSLKEIQSRLEPGARSIPAPPEPTPAADTKPKRAPLLAASLVVLLGIVLALVYWAAKRTPEQTSEAAKPTITENSPPPASSTPASKTTPASKSQPSNGAVVHQVIPAVPRSAQNTITGTIKVVVRVQVDPSGKVTSATLKSAGSSRYFANQALAAAKGWEFAAPEVNGQATASTWLLQFRFKRTSIQASPQRVRG